jgi:hypothetical protein
MADEAEVFTVDTGKLRRGAAIAGVLSVVLSVIIAVEILNLLPRLRLVAYAVPVVALVVSVVLGWNVGRRQVRLAVDAERITVDYLGQRTELPWSGIERVELPQRDGRGFVLVTPGPGLELPGKWRQRGGYRSFTYSGAAFHTEFPRWSPSRKGQIEVVGLGWFDPAARAGILAALRRYAGGRGPA